MDDYESKEETTPENVGDRARSAVGWQALSQFGNYGIRIVTGIVLARLLMPEDFGIVSMATIVTGLAALFRDLGLGQALVQRTRLQDKHIRSTFWVSLIMGGALYAGMYVSAPYLGQYFNDMRMVPVLRLVGLSFLTAPFNVVPGALLQRDLDFKSMFFANVGGKLTYAGTGITLALIGYGYWSLVWAELLSVVVSAVIMCVIVRYLPPIIPSFRGAKELIGFGGGITALSLIGYLRARIDYVLIGRRLTTADLGNYERAYRMGVLPAQLTSSVIHRVLFSALSRIGESKSRVRQVYSRVVTTIALLGLPAAVLLAVSAPELIVSVLGAHWSGAIVPTQVLCIVGAATVLCSPMVVLAKSMGHVYSIAGRQAIMIAILIPAVWMAAGEGIVPVSWIVAGCLVLYWILLVDLTEELAGFGFRSTWPALRGPLLVAAATGITAEFARLLLASATGDLLLLVGLGTVVCGMAVGIATAVFLPLPEMQGARKELVKLIPRILP